METTDCDDATGFKSINCGKILAGLSGFTALTISALSIPFIFPALRKICLPYVPATDQQIVNVLNALKGRKGTLVDLGSGDGRIVFAAAKTKKFVGTGIELNSVLVWYSRIASFKFGLWSNTKFLHSNIWNVNLSYFENIVIFGVEEMMPTLREKLEKEINKKTAVIACRFPIPGWKALKMYGNGIDTVWLYQNQTLDKNCS